MQFSKRQFIMSTSAAFAGAGLVSCTPKVEISASEPALKSMAGNAVNITAAEHQTRVEKAQRLMQEQGIGALLLEAGASLQYFTGIQWWRSERLTAAIIPAEGDLAIVTPHFEEPSIRESLMVGDDVRVWNEHESPHTLVAGILNDRGVTGGKVAIEDTVRFFAVNGLRQAAPQYEIVSGGPIVWGCRMIKSPAELALMQTANDITMAAYRHTIPKVEVGMTQGDISNIMSNATRQLGAGVQFSMALIGESSAYPHGSNKPKSVHEGDIVLMDCGANVFGYESDISRTFVVSEPTKRQREVWNLVRDGQALAFETAQNGTPTGVIDDTVRALYESKGFGPDYQTPGLPHRLGHGIGLEGHEEVNFVRGETTPLAPGMCLSNEPGLYIYGEFGVRLEDCLYMTEAGPKYFSTPPTSLDNPIG
ncbi:MAG: aminopeptidase P family protein [Acidimicrobiales bacterium]|nr:aminopeptidase P family protein [Hyphomonadaceae bacterium]RZV42593.1 MAG: aminopeptidase P family protein [Acidimicrobiales bacterium]